MPPSVPSTSPMRSRTTRVPSRSARFAARSQASQTRWREAALAAVEFGELLVAATGRTSRWRSR